MIGIFYQCLLSANHFSFYILMENVPRTRFIDWNKEGIFSLFGYLSIYFAVESICLIINEIIKKNNPNINTPKLYIFGRYTKPLGVGGRSLHFERGSVADLCCKKFPHPYFGLWNTNVHTHKHFQSPANLLVQMNCLPIAFNECFFFF